jgi:hypothetical protein
MLHQTPYSPDLAPCNFFLFPKLKHSLKGTHFQSIEDIQRKMMGLTKRVHTKLFPEMFPRMEGTHAALYRSPRELL